MLLFDLDELESVFKGSWLWSTKRFNWAWFRRADYMKARRENSLTDAVRGLVFDQLGRHPEGPIHLLTHPRYGGFGMNPVSFYFCFEKDGRTLDVVIAEINNTPWGEQHSYVLDVRANGKRFTFAKNFHVSPFLSMDLRYDWRFTSPDSNWVMHMECHEPGRKIFDSTVVMRRRELSHSALRRQLIKFPLQTVGIFARIYWQALKLRWKGVPVVPHPKHSLRFKDDVAHET